MKSEFLKNFFHKKKRKKKKKEFKTKVKFKRDARSDISTLAIYMNIHDSIILSMKKECTFRSEFIIRMEKSIVSFNNDELFEIQFFFFFFQEDKGLPVLEDYHNKLIFE